MPESGAKLLLIDGNSILYRAFFALPLLSNAEGKHTNAVYGFAMMLLRLLQEERPTHVAVAFDVGKETFRHEFYADYKGTREKTPDELSEQFPMAREMLGAMGIPVLEAEGYEADDLIGTMSREAEADGVQVVVLTGDKDLLQLVSSHVTAVLTRRGIREVERYQPADVEKRFGLRPEQIVDLKGLMGDTSDNIPGVPGVGERTAAKLLQAYGNVEGVYQHLNEVSGKLQGRLAEHRDQAFLSKRLARIHREVPLERRWEDLRWVPAPAREVRTALQKLGFRSLLERIGEVFPVDADGAEGTPDRALGAGVGVGGTLDPGRVQIEEWGDSPTTGRVGVRGLFLDLEGGYQFGTPRGIGVAEGERVRYLLCGEDSSWIEGLTEMLREPGLTVLYDVKSWKVLADRMGFTLPGDAFDVLLAAYLVNPQDGHPDLTELFGRYLGVSVPPLEGRGSPQGEERQRWWALYAAALAGVYPALKRDLEIRGLWPLYHNLELPLSFVLAKMERTGVRVDAARLRSLGETFSAEIARLEEEIYKLAGTTFNLNSPKQLAEILFDKLGLPPQKKTKTGYSTGADVLEKLAPYHEIVQRILDWRQLIKLQSTYIEGLLKVIRPETGKIHTCFQQAVTATGRLSSTDPNLQNIPVRVEEGRRLRQAFIPSESGWKIVSADYSQIELRVLAHFSKDPALVQAFRDDLDIHARTAAEVFEVPQEQVTPGMRRQAKAVNFGIVYGISDYGLSQNLGIPRKEAAEFIARYFAKFPRVKSYMEETVAAARKNGFVTTLLGRRRYLPDIHSSNYNLRSFAERTAMNTPIQGSAADIIKRAMVEVDRRLTEGDFRAKMLLQVHDELVFEVPPEEVGALQDMVKQAMESAVSLDVPLKVDIHAGDNWYEAK
ncbi:MAG: DNA polymerase I [Kyrpidia tusciae]|nr:DNA polymerase I [Kyrpidia tusciae]MBE3551761.1 DNA polymerase I [Kyrpidia tusciae]